MDSVFWKENGKPIIWVLVGVAIIFSASLFLHGKEADSDADFKRLFAKGQLIQGKILEYKPFIGQAQTSIGGAHTEKGIYVTIEYPNSSKLTNKIIETWPYELRDNYVVGDHIEIYYLENNKHIKVSSTHNIQLPQNKQ